MGELFYQFLGNPYVFLFAVLSVCVWNCVRD